MIIVVGGQKGGVEKTTIAINIACEAMKQGKKTLLIDADPQGSCTKWHTWRKEQKLEITKLYQLKGDVYVPLMDQDEVYELIVVDSGGVDAIEMRSAILAADILISPVRPGQFDIETLEKMNQVVRQAIAQGNRDLQAKVILTHTPTHPVMADEKEARRIIDELPAFSQITGSLKYRSAYWRTASNGLAVSEGDDKKATREIQNMVNEVLKDE